MTHWGRRPDRLSFVVLPGQRQGTLQTRSSELRLVITTRRIPHASPGSNSMDVRPVTKTETLQASANSAAADDA